MIRTSRLAEHRDLAPFAAEADTVPRVLHHQPHTSRRLLLHPHVVNSSRLLIYPNPALHFQSPDLPFTTTPPTPHDYLPAFERTSLTGKVLNFGRVWSAQGRRIFEAANNEMALLYGVF